MTIADNLSGIRKQHRRFLNWVDAFWGYDVFIAHRRVDAAEYAQKYYDALKAQRISCFIDRAVYGPGDYLAVATKRHVRKSTVFVLLGSPEILSSRKPKDWVEEEVNEYLAFNEFKIPKSFRSILERPSQTRRQQRTRFWSASRTLSASLRVFPPSPNHRPKGCSKRSAVNSTVADETAHVSVFSKSQRSCWRSSLWPLCSAQHCFVPTGEGELANETQALAALSRARQRRETPRRIELALAAGLAMRARRAAYARGFNPISFALFLRTSPGRRLGP